MDYRASRLNERREKMHISIDPAVVKRIKLEAELTRRSVSNVIEMAMLDFFKNK